MQTYIRLNDLADMIGNDTNDDQRLRDVLDTATMALEALTGRRFAPYYATIKHEAHEHDRSALPLRTDLLELVQITDADGNDIDLNRVEVAWDGALYRVDGSFWDSPSYQVRALWGWSDDWIDSNQTLSLSLTATDTVIVVDNVAGMDAFGMTPALSVGQMLRVDAEFMRVVAVDAVNNQLTVTRAVNGSQVSTHSQGAKIETFLASAQVRSLILRWALWLYRLPDARVMSPLPTSLIQEALRLSRVVVA